MTRGYCCSTVVMISCRAIGPQLSNAACATRRSGSRPAWRALHGVHSVALGPAQLQRAAFVLAGVPIAAIKPHLEHREPPPAQVDELITATYHAIVQGKRQLSG